MPDHYAVQKGQSLTDIAGELTHSTDRTVKQNMANVLFAANPSAFAGNNPSRLKIGSVLNVPQPGANPASAAVVASAPVQAASTGTAAMARPASAVAAPGASAPATAAAGSMPSVATAAPAAAATTGAAGASGAMSNTASASSATTAHAPAGVSAPTAAVAGAQASSLAMASEASSAPLSAAAASDTSASASAPVAGSGAHAWAGTIAPAPAVPVVASEASATSASANAVPSQNVSSLQQLLQLKNRVLAAMQTHGLGSNGSNAAGAAASASQGTAPAESHPSAAAAVQGASAPAHSETFRGPLAIPAAFAILIVVALGIWLCLPPRKRVARPVFDGSPSNSRGEAKAVSASTPVSSADPSANGEKRVDDIAGDALPGDRANSPVMPLGGMAAGAAVAGAAMGASGLASARPPAVQGAAPTESADTFRPDGEMVVPEGEAELPPGTPPFSLEGGATGGLPTHDPQRPAFAEARTPYDTGLLLGLLEMHAHRHEASRFEELAHELWELTDGEGPDWKRAAELGRRIDPDNPLYSNDPFVAYRDQHDGATSGFAKPLPNIDLDLPEPPVMPDWPPRATTPAAREADLAEDRATRTDPNSVAPAAVPPKPDLPPTVSTPPAPRATSEPPSFDWLDEAPSTSSAAVPPARSEPSLRTPPLQAEGQGGSFSSASVEPPAPLPEATPPAHVPVAELHDTPPFGVGDADQPPASAGEEIERGTAGPGSVAGLGAGVPSAGAPGALTGAPPNAPPGIGAAGFDALKLDFDLELTPNAAAPGSSPTSHDLATIARNKLDLAAEYVELGDRAGARTLLNEVLATHDPATRERAQALLASLS
jgi:pilus assembly protein FimV